MPRSRLCRTDANADFFALDAFSYVELPHISNAKERFESWVDKRILPHEDVLAGAADLYAARSAILHRLGVRSRLLDSGIASAIMFSHGTAPFDGLI